MNDILASDSERGRFELCGLGVGFNIQLQCHFHQARVLFINAC